MTSRLTFKSSSMGSFVSNGNERLPMMHQESRPERASASLKQSLYGTSGSSNEEHIPLLPETETFAATNDCVKSTNHNLLKNMSRAVRARTSSLASDVSSQHSKDIDSGNSSLIDSSSSDSCHEFGRSRSRTTSSSKSDQNLSSYLLLDHMTAQGVARLAIRSTGEMRDTPTCRSASFALKHWKYSTQSTSQDYSGSLEDLQTLKAATPKENKCIKGQGERSGSFGAPFFPTNSHSQSCHHIFWANDLTVSQLYSHTECSIREWNKNKSFSAQTKSRDLSSRRAYSTGNIVSLEETCTSMHNHMTKASTRGHFSCGSWDDHASTSKASITSSGSGGYKEPFASSRPDYLPKPDEREWGRSDDSMASLTCLCQSSSDSDSLQNKISISNVTEADILAASESNIGSAYPEAVTSLDSKTSAFLHHTKESNAVHDIKSHVPKLNSVLCYGAPLAYTSLKFKDSSTHGKEYQHPLQVLVPRLCQTSCPPPNLKINAKNAACLAAPPPPDLVTHQHVSYLDKAHDSQPHQSFPGDDRVKRTPPDHISDRTPAPPLCNEQNDTITHCLSPDACYILDQNRVTYSHIEILTNAKNKPTTPHVQTSNLSYAITIDPSTESLQCHSSNQFLEGQLVSDIRSCSRLPNPSSQNITETNLDPSTQPLSNYVKTSRCQEIPSQTGLAITIPESCFDNQLAGDHPVINAISRFPAEGDAFCTPRDKAGFRQSVSHSIESGNEERPQGSPHPHSSQTELLQTTRCKVGHQLLHWNSEVPDYRLLCLAATIFNPVFGVLAFLLNYLGVRNYTSHRLNRANNFYLATISISTSGIFLTLIGLGILAAHAVTMKPPPGSNATVYLCHASDETYMQFFSLSREKYCELKDNTIVMEALKHYYLLDQHHRNKHARPESEQLSKSNTSAEASDPDRSLSLSFQDVVDYRSFNETLDSEPEDSMLRNTVKESKEKPVMSEEIQKLYDSSLNITSQTSNSFL
uniref:Uncharacterized protein n=1 Tax=Biomphalaria glabrata TaxID=6526 RepID=A0A2C9L0W1_BIOGL